MLNLRQRSLLGVLGIPVWISRQRGTQPAAPSFPSIWRDQNEVSDSNTPTTENLIKRQKVIEPIISSPAMVTPIDKSETIAVISKTHISLPEHQLLQPVALTTVDNKGESLKFHLHIVETPQWLILVSAEELKDPAATQLWQNIQLAFGSPTLFQFSWPLAEGQRWQSGVGAKAALSGFLFRLGLDKRAGLIGDLPDHICPDRLERLPRLSELLEEPLKKRQLWHVLKTA